jgi:hypothetical protein
VTRLILAVLFALRVLLTAASADAQEMTVDVFGPSQPVSDAYKLPDAAPAAVVEVAEPITCDVFGSGTADTCYPIQPREAGPVAISVDVFAMPSKPAALKPIPADTVRYPIRDKATWWSGCPSDRFSAIAHLSSGDHAGLFDAAWLSTLSLEELQSLHSDHHDGCVDETRIKRAPLAAIKTKPVVPAPPVATVQQSTQPNCTVFWNGRQWVRVCR